jgi:sideroflexin-5
MAIVDTGKPVFLPFRMSSFVLSNLVVTAGMLTPGLQVRTYTPPSALNCLHDPN